MKKDRESDTIGKRPTDLPNSSPLRDSAKMQEGRLTHLNDIKYHKHNMMNDYTFNAITGSYYGSKPQ